MWKIRQVDEATGSFEMIASDKPDACLRILAAEDCRSQPALVDTRIISSPESKKYTSWKIFKRYDLAPKASPPPPSPPPSPPLPSLPLGPASGPVISAASSTKSGYVVVNIENVGGDNRCSVSSITLTSIGSALGSLPQTVEVAAPMPAISAKGVYVPVVQYGYNSVYAIGRCNNGETTEQSNVLAVFFARDVGTVPGAPMSVSAGNITATSAIISWLDGNLGDPEERYSVTCVPSSVSTCGDPGVSVTDIPRGDETVLVSGLSSNTNYSCWVKSMNNEGERCSSQPAIFETPHEWALGQLGESCDQACSKTGRICNHEPQRDIVTLDQYSFVANLLDVQVFSNTYNCQGLACKFPEIPGFQLGLNGINSGVSNCVGSRNGVQRFCCCGPSATCPVA